MDSKIIYVIVILVFILIISLAIGMYYSYNFMNQEGFQSLSKSQIIDMSQCTMNIPGCRNINYYDSVGKLQNGNFLNLPNNLYLDSNNTLQPVPYGNIVSSDHQSYKVDSKYSIGKFSVINNLKEDAIINPTTCIRMQTMFYYPNTNVVCADVSFITINDDIQTINNGEIIIPDGYYIDSKTGLVKVIPYGYKADRDKRSISMTTDYSNQVSSTSYNSNNLDLTYHTDISNNSTLDSSTAGSGKMWILDQSGNLISIPYSDISGSTLYNEPGSFRFGSSNYIPNYEESVYLSKLTNISTLTPVNNSTAYASGFCSALYPNKNALEQACNALDTNACGSTSCCALLGGEKCVYGSEAGPYFKSNYSNFMIKNTEFYYYQGKCYGNCPS